MLIEWNKLDFRQRDNNLSHVYLMFTVGWDRQLDQPTGKASYQGAVSLEKLRSSCPTTVVLHKGDALPGTSTILQADNFGIRFADLYKHLNHLVGFFEKSPPPASLTENFRNPYTGETTLELLGKEETHTKTELSDVQRTDVAVDKRITLAARIKSLFKRVFRGSK